jgi:hypothetical protein
MRTVLPIHKHTPLFVQSDRKGRHVLVITRSTPIRSLRTSARRKHHPMTACLSGRSAFRVNVR